jgi:hypothetical protein
MCTTPHRAMIHRQGSASRPITTKNNCAAEPTLGSARAIDQPVKTYRLPPERVAKLPHGLSIFSTPNSGCGESAACAA